MEEEMSKSGSLESQNGQSQDTRPPLTETDVRGKHRKLAELNRLNQEIRYLEEELDELDKTEKAASPCKEMINTVESTPDPLLPVTRGPANPIWDRWFEGPIESDACRCWIF
uniref:TSA: Wollemia nobilis Ref_Wollemi_Transcript_26263_1144 transcribed RNA sequence n=1 Tax=Wollemia nobilis TaxID=56998 RepID=A0A0C9RGM4_9CONI